MKILLVDDEIEVRKTLKNMLAGIDDIEAIYAADAVSALLLLKDDKDIEAVVTDYRLPGLGGENWITLLKHYHPAVNIVVISGYEVALEKLKKMDVKALRKPFDKYQLLQAIGR